MKLAKITKILLSAALSVTLLSAMGMPADSRQMSPLMMSFSGTIIEIEEFDGQTIVTVENADEAIVNFLIIDDVFLAEGVVLEEGSRVTGWYDASLPVALIYPPRHVAAAFSGCEGGPPFVYFDRFRAHGTAGQMISYSEELVLNLSDDTEIILEDGTEFAPGPDITALDNRLLMVFYSITTRSIPPQTPPEKIVVFFEQAVHPIGTIDPPIGTIVPIVPPIGTIDPEDLPQIEEPDYSWVEEIFPPRGTMVPLVVEGELVEEVGLQYLPNGTVLVPLRIVADALGIEIGWHDESQTITWDDDIRLTIGVDSYIRASTEANISIGAAPVLINDRTYVPLQFFRYVAEMNNAFFFEGQIEINNFERME